MYDFSFKNYIINNLFKYLCNIIIKIKNMKTLIDGFEVSLRSYYYLLDWNELNEWEYFTQEFNKTRLCDLTRVEYKRLFNTATLYEMNQMN